MKLVFCMTLMVMTFAYFAKAKPAPVKDQERNGKWRMARESGFCAEHPPIFVDCAGLCSDYYYDVKSGECKIFLNGCCPSTKNWFRTLEDCNKTCGDTRVAADKLSEKDTELAKQGDNLEETAALSLNNMTLQKRLIKEDIKVNRKKQEISAIIDTEDSNGSQEADIFQHANGIEDSDKIREASEVRDTDGTQRVETSTLIEERRDRREIKRWRDDYKCQGLYWINNNADGTPAECDPNSHAPCCSNFGWCGQGYYWCRCQYCIDYREKYATTTTTATPETQGFDEMVKN